MKRKKSRIRWRMPPLLTVCYYGFCPDAEAWEAEKKRAAKRGNVTMGEYPSSCGMTASWRSLRTNCLYVIVTVKREKSRHSPASVLVHESVHVVRRVFEEAADTHPSEECEAYMLTHIFEKLMRDYRRAGRKK